MISAAIFLGACLGHQSRVAIKETLPNGVIVYAQRIEGTTQMAATLASVSKDQPETADSHGMRHLLEHLVAKGPDKDVDKGVEGRGMVLLAETTRDSVTFSLHGPKDTASMAVTVLGQLVSRFDVNESELRKEVGILDQEMVLRSWNLLLVADGWRKVYGADALDPFGDPAKMTNFTTEAVKAGFQSLANPKKLCLCVAGDIDPESVVQQAREVLGGLTATDVTPWSRPEATDPALVGSSDGEAACIPVSGFSESATLASIGAGFGLQGWLTGSFMVYTPTARPGLVTVSLRTGRSWKQAADRLKGREALVARTGMQQLKEWLTETASDPVRLSELSATILPLRPGFDPSRVSHMADDVSEEQILGEIRAVCTLASGGSQ